MTMPEAFDLLLEDLLRDPFALPVVVGFFFTVFSPRTERVFEEKDILLFSFSAKTDKMTCGRIIAVIPARLASTRFPGKALASLGGTPLVVQTWRNVMRSGVADIVFVATDTEAIKAVIEREEGGVAVLTESSARNGTERIGAALELDFGLKTSGAQWTWNEEKNRFRVGPDDVILNVQGDAPTLPGYAMKAAIDILRNSPPSVPMSSAAVPLKPRDINNASEVKVVLDLAGYALYWSRAPIPGGKVISATPGSPSTMKALGVYAYRAPFLPVYRSLAPSPLQVAEDLEQLRALEHGFRIPVAVVASFDGPSVDTPEDLVELQSGKTFSARL